MGAPWRPNAEPTTTPAPVSAAFAGRRRCASRSLRRELSRRVGRFVLGAEDSCGLEAEDVLVVACLEDLRPKETAGGDGTESRNDANTADA
jgi:hypothetical protein